MCHVKMFILQMQICMANGAEEIEKKQNGKMIELTIIFVFGTTKRCLLN